MSMATTKEIQTTMEIVITIQMEIQMEISTKTATVTTIPKEIQTVTPM